MVDLKIAVNLFNKFKKDDLGQSIIVDRCRIVGVEGAFGTDQIINNYKKFNKTRKKHWNFSENTKKKIKILKLICQLLDIKQLKTV